MSQYIGSRISLFSNSDIRYVGVLHEIDADASTLTLKDVRSFGTEGRKHNTTEEIPASDNVYEFIVFRGSEVKDLVIEEEEEAPQPPKQSIPNDPAIIQNAAPPAGFRQPPPAQYPPPQPQQGFVPPYYPQQPFMPYPPQPNYDQSPVTVAGAPVPQAATIPQQRAPVRQPAGPTRQPATIPPAPVQETKPDAPPVQTAGRINVVPAVPVPKARQTARQHRQGVPAAVPESVESNVDQAHNAAQDLLEKLMLESPSEAAPAVPAAATATMTTTSTAGEVPTGPARGNVPQRGFRQNGTQRYNYNNYGRHSGAAARAPRVDVPASDFNFEESNAKFQKDAIAKEVSATDEDDVDNVDGEESESTALYYDKSSSFFDNLSSGTKERSDDRLGRHQERQLNMETFGQASVDTGRYRGRGRGRGRGAYYGRGRTGHGPRGGFRAQGAPNTSQQQQA
ncbi:Scd6-like Sm domain-containing protein [Lipomyces kononenkoae]|uniref:Scd6-like Sm domain-containing protein n=1 Tax=Lipomyces kononenkoae TaxID=34357 RepID=A0ACC3T3A9_LIPKO